MDPVYIVECDHYYFNDELTTKMPNMKAAQDEAERMLDTVAQHYGVGEVENCSVTISVVFAVRRVHVETTLTYKREDFMMPALGALATVDSRL